MKGFSAVAGEDLPDCRGGEADLVQPEQLRLHPFRIQVPFLTECKDANLKLRGELSSGLSMRPTSLGLEALQALRLESPPPFAQDRLEDTTTTADEARISGPFAAPDAFQLTADLGIAIFGFRSLSR